MKTQTRIDQVNKTGKYVFWSLKIRNEVGQYVVSGLADEIGETKQVDGFVRQFEKLNFEELDHQQRIKFVTSHVEIYRVQVDAEGNAYGVPLVVRDAGLSSLPQSAIWLELSHDEQVGFNFHWSAGNYDSAYGRPNIAEKLEEPHLKAAYLLGWFSSYENHEAIDDCPNIEAIRDKWNPVADWLGITT